MRQREADEEVCGICGVWERLKGPRRRIADIERDPGTTLWEGPVGRRTAGITTATSRSPTGAVVMAMVLVHCAKREMPLLSKKVPLAAAASGLVRASRELRSPLPRSGIGRAPGEGPPMSAVKGEMLVKDRGTMATVPRISIGTSGTEKPDDEGGSAGTAGQRLEVCETIPECATANAEDPLTSAEGIPALPRSTSPVAWTRGDDRVI